jgi:nitrate reductase (NAD(P)H)
MVITMKREVKDRKVTDEAMYKHWELREAAQDGKLLNFSDIMKGQSDFHGERPRRPGKFTPGWRFMVLARGNWIYNDQEWPANIKRREIEEADRKKKDAVEKRSKEKNGPIEGS